MLCQMNSGFGLYRYPSRVRIYPDQKIYVSTKLFRLPTKPFRKAQYRSRFPSGIFELTLAMKVPAVSIYLCISRLITKTSVVKMSTAKRECTVVMKYEPLYLFSRRQVVLADDTQCSWSLVFTTAYEESSRDYKRSIVFVCLHILSEMKMKFYYVENASQNTTLTGTRDNINHDSDTDKFPIVL